MGEPGNRPPLKEPTGSVNFEPEESAVLSRVDRWARDDDRVRVVLLTSSRANRASPRDALTDYDVAVVTPEPDAFSDDGWLGSFGTPLVRVRDVESVDGLDVHHCMSIFDDWAKIDFSFWPAIFLDRVRVVRRLPDEFAAGYRVLLDKDGATADWPVPTETPWTVARPTEREFDDLVQEFWFVATYVAKYLWRNELLAAKVIFDYELKYLVVRRLLDWRAGAATGWSVPSGFFGRGLRQRLDAETWDAFMATYVGADPAESWAALFATTDLFRRAASELAAELGVSYPIALDERMTAYLRAIENLGAHPSRPIPH